MPKKAGRPAKHWTDSVTGEVVNGLARRPCKPDKPGRFYAIGHNKTFGADEQIAIRRYHAWKQGHTPGALSSVSPVELSAQGVLSGLFRARLRDEEGISFDYLSPPCPSHAVICGGAYIPFVGSEEGSVQAGSNSPEPTLTQEQLDDARAYLKEHRRDTVGVLVADLNAHDAAFIQAVVIVLQGEVEQQLAGVPDHLRPLVGSVEFSSTFETFMVSTGRDRDLADGEILGREGYAQHWPAFFDWVIGNWIRSKPKEAANRLGISALANLEAIKPRPPSLPLAKIADLYESRSTGRKLYNKESARLFRRFTKIIGVRTVRDIEDHHIVKYEKRILDEFHKKDRGDAWLSKRFQGIRRVFRHARKRSTDRDQITRVLGLCEMLEIPKSTASAERAPEPNPITREHLHAILALADVRQAAIILLSLNCLYLPIDNARLPEEAIDFETGSVYFPRVKPRTKIPRVAVLWERTLRALRAYQAEYPHDARDDRGRKVLIVTQQLKPLTENSHTWFCKWWRSLREQAGLPADVTFKTLRSGGYTEACQVSRDQAEVLAGHLLPGKTDHYLKRNPRFVAPACRAIERHYFG